jgi:uncharacterized protein (TIGR02466 family)
MPGAIEVHSPFSPPIYATKLDLTAEALKGVRAEIEKRRDTDPGIEVTSRNAWRSSGTDLLDDPRGGPLAELRGHVLAVARGALATHYADSAKAGWEPFVADSWATIGGRGAAHVPHNHGPSPWSGIVYVDVETALREGTSPRAGRLEILSPIAASQAFFVPSGAVFDPSDGLMLLFPSPMLHLVHPTEGDAPRITVAFDLGIRFSR